LNARAKQLGRFPQSGRVVPESNLRSFRELIVGPYRILYLLVADGVEIVTVVHGTQI